MRSLQDSRKEIDKIDEEMIKLFERRMEVCRDVADYKLKTGKPVLDRKRELKVRHRMISMLMALKNCLNRLCL